MSRADEIARRTSHERFRNRRLELIAELARLLGIRPANQPVEDLARASALADVFLQDHAASESLEILQTSRWWNANQTDDLADTLHRLSAFVGSQPVWLIVAGREPQAVLLPSDEILDNPFGFSALGDSELRLLAHDVPGGVWLVRHSFAGTDGVAYRWELEAWGEPWRKAAARAIRNAD